MVLMRKILLIILLQLVAEVSLYAYEGKTVDPDENPVVGVDIIFYNAQNDSIGSVSSGNSGEFEYGEEVGFIVFAHPDYEILRADVRGDKDGYFFLKPVRQLGEFVVTAEAAQRFLTHDSYIISRKAMKKYLNPLDVLNEIPFVSTQPKGELKYKGQGGVGLMVNGIPATEEEVASLSKDDIAKVNLYTMPPQEFVGKNINAAIDIILKENITGGNGSLQTSNAVTQVWGDNNASFYYNYKRSRFSVNVNNDYRRMWGENNDETLSYNFDGINYIKTKTGEGGKSHVNENSAVIAFQNGLANDYLVNVSLSGEINRVNGSISQNVVMPDGDRYSALSLYHNPNQRLTAAASFRKYLGKEGKDGYVYTAFSWSGNEGKNFNSYEETAFNDGTPVFWAETSIRQRTNSIFGRVDYVSGERTWGRVSLSVQDSHRTYKELESPSDSYLRTNWLNVYATYFARYQKFYFYALAGIVHNETFIKTLDAKDRKTSPVVNAKIYYYPSRPFRFDVGYNFGMDGPSLAQRTATPQWRDNYYVYQGNPDLENFSAHKVMFNGSYNNRYVEAAVGASFFSSPKYIGTFFEYSDRYILETLVNQKKYQSFNTSFYITVFPLGKRIWSVRGAVRWGRIWGENNIYTYHGDDTFYSISSAVNLNKWNLGGNVQFQSEKFSGTSTVTRPFVWSIYGYFRPTENVSVGISWSSPFMKHSHTKEWTVKEALVHMNRNLYSKAFANKLAIEINYYFNFGKRHNNYEDVYTGSPAETGVLKRE